MKKHVSTIILFVIFFIGLSVLLYPTVSDYVNARTQSRAIANYEKAMAKVTQQDYSNIFAQAEDYNERLKNTPEAFYLPDEVEGYWDTLGVSGVGIMGYISIDKINVRLPIYHGTSEGVLNIAVGHLQGSSLPIGGSGTHAVVSAHRGLPSAKLFTDLNQMEEGDTFAITVLDRPLTYRVNQILIVEPHEVDALQLVEGKDYCTLITCTPYAVNSHRLLVRGERIDSGKEQEVVFVPSDAIQIDAVLVAPVVAAPILLILLIYMIISTGKRPAGSQNKEMNEKGKGEAKL